VEIPQIFYFVHTCSDVAIVCFVVDYKINRTVLIISKFQKRSFMHIERLLIYDRMRNYKNIRRNIRTYATKPCVVLLIMCDERIPLEINVLELKIVFLGLSLLNVNMPGTRQLV